MQTRHLTKSLYKTSLECPNKLYYAKKTAYANTKTDNPFLMALAKGGERAACAGL
jgi:hypothetical protein